MSSAQRELQRFLVFATSLEHPRAYSPVNRLNEILGAIVLLYLRMSALHCPTLSRGRVRALQCCKGPSETSAKHRILPGGRIPGTFHGTHCS